MPAGEQDQNLLAADLEWLLHNQAGLDRRLARVEDSVVFRTLRAIGRFYSERIARRPSGGSPGYADWRKRGGGALPAPQPGSRPRVSLLLASTNPQQIARLKQAVAGYSSSEVIAELDQATGDYVACVGEHDEVYPGALEHLAAQAPADVIYSDEEELDETGRPVRPFFKPDWSPILFGSVNYVGGLTAIRRELVQDTADFEAALRSPEALRVVHVPAILYGSRRRVLSPQPVTPAPASSDVLVSIVVCTRTASLIKECLASVRERTAFPRYELIVVQHLDQSSLDDQSIVERVISEHGAKRIPYSAPFHFAEMNNRGVEAASGSVLLFLNDDVTPLKADWLTRMAAWLDKPTVGAVGAKLTFPDGTLQHSGIAAWLTDGAWHPGRGMLPNPNWPWTQYTREVSAVTGACLAVRIADFRRVGGFDPAFPINFNDVDLCFRLRRAGLAVIVDVEADLRHDESRTRSTGSSYEERHRFFRKWHSELTRVDPFYTPHLVQNNEDLSLR